MALKLSTLTPHPKMSATTPELDIESFEEICAMGTRGTHL
jgi:hypothetical protein